jgi:hypothetical protein
MTRRPTIWILTATAQATTPCAYALMYLHAGSNAHRMHTHIRRYQTEWIVNPLAPKEGQIVPWTWEEAMYQDGPDTGNLAAPPPKNSLVPWTWDDVIYQIPESE